jgi:type I restriction enzyme, S subunit
MEIVTIKSDVGMKWEMVKLGDVLDYEQPTNYIVSSDLYDDNFDTPVLTAGKSFILGYTNETNGVFSNLPVIIFDDFTTVSKYVDFPFKVKSSAMKILRAKEGAADIRYMFYLLQTLNVDSEQHKRYWISTFAPLQIPLPPLPIQKRIAEILDAADALKLKDQQLLQKYDELAQAIFIDMFGDPVKNEKGWEVKTINESIEFMTSGSRGWAQYYSESGDLFLRINNVGYNELKLQELIFVNAPNNAEAIRTEVKSGDILLSITADLGRTCVIPDDFPKTFINQHLAILRLKNSFEPVFVSQVLSSEYGKLQFRKLNKGGVKAGLNFDDIKSLEFINPPINYQRKYKKILQEVKKQFDTLILLTQQSDNLFQTLIQKAFKGELVA